MYSQNDFNNSNGKFSKVTTTLAPDALRGPRTRRAFNGAKDWPRLVSTMRVISKTEYLIQIEGNPFCSLVIILLYVT